MKRRLSGPALFFEKDKSVTTEIQEKGS